MIFAILNLNIHRTRSGTTCKTVTNNETDAPVMMVIGYAATRLMQLFHSV